MSDTQEWPGATEAPGLIEPAPVASRDAGVRFQFTLGVDDVDAMCQELEQLGIWPIPGPSSTSPS